MLAAANGEKIQTTVPAENVEKKSDPYNEVKARVRSIRKKSDLIIRRAIPKKDPNNEDSTTIIKHPLQHSLFMAQKE